MPNNCLAIPASGEQHNCRNQETKKGGSPTTVYPSVDFSPFAVDFVLGGHEKITQNDCQITFVRFAEEAFLPKAGDSTNETRVCDQDLPSKIGSQPKYDGGRWIDGIFEAVEDF